MRVCVWVWLVFGLAKALELDDEQYGVVAELVDVSFGTQMAQRAATVEKNTTSAVAATESTVDSEPMETEVQSPPYTKGITSVEEFGYPYKEELFIRPLKNNHLLASFEFDIESEPFNPRQDVDDVFAFDQYTVFPRVFKPLLTKTSTRQLQMRFTRGYWDSESWGALPHNGFQSGGNGVELWAIIEAGSKQEAYKNWKTLVNSLSGLFCASINFIDESKTTYPMSSFQPDHMDGIPLLNLDADSNKLYLLHASLANEPICTENLTPLVKLLPTRGKSGLSQYLDGHKIFDSLWHSLSIDIDTNCDDSTHQCKFIMDANLNMAIHLPSTLDRIENPIPKPLTGERLRCDMSKEYDAFQCFPLPESNEINFKLSQLFNKKIKGISKFSHNPTTICGNVTTDWEFNIETVDGIFGTEDNCFTLDQLQEYDIDIRTHNSSNVVRDKDLPLFVSRALTGYGQDRGGMRTIFKNVGNEPITITYFETLPWFMRVYLSSLQIENLSLNNDPTMVNDESITVDKIMETINYIPAMDRTRPTLFEFTIEIPAKSSFSMSYQYDKTLLQFAEYPPDANHGFELEAAVITVTRPIQYQMRTSTLLLSLSTPDFSMPYNVIIISSTIMGLIFGMTFNLLVKRLVTLDEANILLHERSIKNKILSLRDKILVKLGIISG